MTFNNNKQWTLNDSGSLRKSNEVDTGLTSEELFKSLVERGMHTSALNLRNWGTVDSDAAIVAEELSKAAPNVGSGSNDASGKTPLRNAWAKKKKMLEGQVDRLESMAEGKPKDHGIHGTLDRAQKELDDHLDNHPG